MIIINLFNLYILKTVPRWNISVSLTCCVHALLEWLQIMLLLGNIDWDSFLRNLLYIHMIIILLRWEYTFYIDVHDIRSYRILK